MTSYPNETRMVYSLDTYPDWKPGAAYSPEGNPSRKALGAGFWLRGRSAYLRAPAFRRKALMASPLRARPISLTA